jgi:hypothetical protein
MRLPEELLKNERTTRLGTLGFMTVSYNRKAAASLTSILDKRGNNRSQRNTKAELPS